VRPRVISAVRHPSDPEKDAYQEENTFIVDPSAGWPSTNLDRIKVTDIAGSLESGRIRWVQFHVYCGQSKEPFLVTRKLTARDFVKQDRRNFYYFVK
jgi:hypothetical protein